MWWLIVVVVVAAGLGAYLTWTAGRVERLHQRARSAESALLGALDDRAELILTFIGSPDYEKPSALALSVVAVPVATPQQREMREYAENDLTRALRDLTEDAPGHAEVSESNRRVSYARQIHSDVVRDALAARDLPTVRWLGLLRRLERPAYWDIEDPSRS
ncbi:hypothetical protein [Haloglycomyces albus]|uniref:hypothetical protein n=1 Tax=Haloglycomyces albus TaxID=526067 RepID=UPI00046D6A67|nr:hypothetical protein [Haloglycomyces albus]